MILSRKDLKVIDILESHGVYHIKTYKQGRKFYTEAEFYSPAGEDFVFDIWHDGTLKGFSDGLRECVNSYDSEEHAEMWIPNRGKNGIPLSIRVLLDDADAIEERLYQMHIDISEYVYS